MLIYKILRDVNKNAYVNSLFSKSKKIYIDKTSSDDLITSKDEEITHYEIDFENKLEIIRSKVKRRSAEITIEFDYTVKRGENPFNRALKNVPEAEGVIMIKSSRLYIYLYVTQAECEFDEILTPKSEGINFNDEDFYILKVEECQVREENRCDLAPKSLSAREDDTSEYVIKCEDKDACFVCYLGDKEVVYSHYLNWQEDFLPVNCSSDESDIVKIDV